MNNHIIAKTALKTLLAVIIAIIIAFGVASLAFPAGMASVFESMGNYTLATGYASLAYTYSPTTENLSRCVEYSILAGDDGNIMSFAEKLVEADDFDDYCASVDEAVNSSCEKKYGKTYKEQYGYAYSYRQFVYGHLACAQYNRGKKNEAIATAEAAMGGDFSSFPRNNALFALARRYGEKQDTDSSKDKLLEVLQKFHPIDENEAEYLSVAISYLTR